MGHASMAGNEGVVHYDVLAASAGQAGNLPIVVNRVVPARQQVRAEIGQLAPVELDCSGDRTKIDPSAMVAAAGERPSAAQPIATGHALSFARWRIGR